MESLISIIVPVYNVEAYLPKCLDSILAQTYSNLEIILVDDGSTDSSGRICDEYAEKDCRIKVLHKENGGVSSARNAGLKIYSGEYLMYVDPDDYISIDAVQVLYERVLSDGSDMVIGKHTDVYDDERTNGAFCSWIKDAVLSKKDVFTMFEGKNHYPVGCVAKLYRRELFEGITFPPLKCGEDLWVFPLIIDRCVKISVLDRVIYFYFQRSNSVMHKKTEQVKHDELDATLHLVQFLWQREFKTSAYNWYARSISKAICFQDKRIAIDQFRRYFNRSERKKILKGVKIKERIKWISLFFPFINGAVRFVKRVVKRG